VARGAGTIALACLLAACAALPGARLAGDLIVGRLSVRVEGTDGAPPKSMNAAFELEGSARVGKLSLASPLGAQLAQVRWEPGHAMLVTPQRETPYDDLDRLTAEVLGESIPVGALFDWLRGRPWPGAPSESSRPPADPGFRQLGWTVNLASFDEALVSARRELPPVVTVRAKVDRP
jgi:outer membrane lipoprotein LolB